MRESKEGEEKGGKPETVPRHRAVRDDDSVSFALCTRRHRSHETYAAASLCGKVACCRCLCVVEIAVVTRTFCSLMPKLKHEIASRSWRKSLCVAACDDLDPSDECDDDDGGGGGTEGTLEGSRIPISSRRSRNDLL